eukprot:scaffold140014_cov18-Tisochrysis_lutea.AAC.1
MAKSEGGQKLQALARSAAAWWTSCTAWLEFEAAGTEAGAAAAADDAGNAVPRRAWMSAMHRLSWIRKLEASATPCTAKLLALMRASFLSAWKTRWAQCVWCPPSMLHIGGCHGCHEDVPGSASEYKLTHLRSTAHWILECLGRMRQCVVAERQH